MTSLLNNKKLQACIIFYVAVMIFLGRQLDVGISNYDDAYYAQKAKEIFSSESWWVVTFDGSPAFDNPPLPFWLTATAYKVFGVSSYAAVFFPALFGAGIVLLTYRGTLHLFRDNWTALTAVFVLLFPGFFVDSARRGMLDIPLAFFVTAAMFCFVKGLENKKFYLLYGLATACAVLTKSLLGFFPLIVGVAFFIFSRKWKEILNPYFLSGLFIAVGMGASWYLVNWMKFGDEFIKFHFGYIILDRGFSENDNPFFFLGYAKDFLKLYWPWLPVAVIGLCKFAKRGFAREKDEAALLIFLWVVIVFVVMSTSKTQTLRYVLMIFPALAILVAKTLSDWFSENAKERCLPYMVGIILLAVLFVNVTPFQVKVTLKQNSRDIRQLATVMNLNTPPGQSIGNYRLSDWNPRNALYFYADRLIAHAVADPAKLIERLEKRPDSTWLAATGAYNELEALYPGKLYLIQANGKYAYFTSMQNRENVRYDFSGITFPRVR